MNQTINLSINRSIYQAPLHLKVPESELHWPCTNHTTVVKYGRPICEVWKKRIWVLPRQSCWTVLEASVSKLFSQFYRSSTHPAGQSNMVKWFKPQIWRSSHDGLILPTPAHPTWCTETDRHRNRHQLDPIAIRVQREGQSSSTCWDHLKPHETTWIHHPAWIDSYILM